MLATSQEGGVVVIDLTGRLDMQTSTGVQEQLLQALSDNPPAVLIGLSGLEFISSAGLRVILRAAKQVNGYQGVLKVCCAEGIVKEVLEVSGFDNLLEHHDTRQQALVSFQ